MMPVSGRAVPVESQKADQTDHRKPFRVAQIAALLDVHQATIYRDIECGRLKALRVGAGKGALRIMPAALDAYLALLEVRAVTAVA
jgi:excisionase family DNA binding protein